MFDTLTKKGFFQKFPVLRAFKNRTKYVKLPRPRAHSLYQKTIIKRKFKQLGLVI